MSKKTIMGIDWGTSRTYPAVIDEEGKCQSLLPSGNHFCNGGIPSLFAYNKKDGMTLCDEVLSEELEIFDPQHVIPSIKMHMGETFYLDGREFDGKSIAASVIKMQMEYARNELELQDLEADEKKVVVCAPVSFGTTERSNLMAAFEMTGYKVIRIIPEPVAAAIYYGRKGTVLVVDIGAGTTDVALVKENPLRTVSNPYPYLHIAYTFQQ